MPRSRNGGSTVSGPSSNAAALPMRTGESRTEPTSSVPMRAVNESSSRWPDPFTDAIGGLGVATRTEGALVQPLDRDRVRGSLRHDVDGKVDHCLTPRLRD